MHHRIKIVGAYLALFIVLLSAGHAQVWVRKADAQGLGNPLTYNPLNSDILYASAGSNLILISRNRGYNWSNFSSIPSSGGKITSIAVSPNDTLQFVVGVQVVGSPDMVMKTTNGGTSWTTTWYGTFNYFGQSVEFKPQHPDTVYTMSNDTIWRSTDFGSSWHIKSIVSGQFNSWCDAEIRPDSANIIFVGDNASGIWKSTDYGSSWRKVYSTIGEIPSIAVDPFNPQVAYAAKFSGGGGIAKTTNGGERWDTITTPIGNGNAWWVTTSKESPNYVYFGTYGAAPVGPFMSRDAGASWVQIATPDSGQNFNQLNYGLLVTDTLTVLALQANGLFKLYYPESIQLLNHLGGEFLHAGSLQTIHWSDSNITRVKVELTSDNGVSWMEVADTVGAEGTIYWAVPSLTSSLCKFRVSNYYNSTMYSMSDTTFTIYTDPLTFTSPNGGESWDEGSNHIVSWICGVPLSLKLEYTIDSGATWNFLAYINPNIFSFDWVLPTKIHSTQCLLKLTDVNDTTTFDVSDSLFSINAIVDFFGMLDIEGGTGERDTLYFGSEANATSSIDTSLGESELSPKPSLGTFDVRWNISGTNGTKKDIRDTLTDLRQENIFTGELQSGTTGEPLVMRWDPNELRAGTFILRDTETHGKRLFRDMTHIDSLVFNDTSQTSFEILQCQTQSINFSGTGGWELISLPFLTGDLKKTSLFPNSTSEAYSYGQGYVVSDSLRYGSGYWVRLNQVTFTGCRRTVDTIFVVNKWNLVGSLSDSLPLSSIRTIPESLLTSSFYGYNGGYFTANQLEPGKGYWVKASGPGMVILDRNAMQNQQAVKKYRDEQYLNTLTVSDEGGNRQSIYFGTGNGEIDGRLFDLPPTPPKGGFDVRFSTQRSIEIQPQNLNSEMEYPILLQNQNIKNIFSWNVEFDKNFSYILTRKMGSHRVGETRLTGSGSLTIENVEGIQFSMRVLPVLEEETPLSYSLSPNYPNPFNPVTTLRYTLPQEANVTLRVFNSLGQEVVVLYNGNQTSGIHEIQWDGVDDKGLSLSSGVYYVMMNVTHVNSSVQNAFSAIRSIILLK